MTTTVPSNISDFNLAQVFFVDPGAVKNSPEVSITKIGLFFKSVPKKTGNKSGINSPGVDVFLCQTKNNNNKEIPDVNAMVFGGHARVEYDDIDISTISSTETSFTFPHPINVDTGKSYAIIVKYDGNEDFVLWTSVEGDNLVGTSNKTAGPAGKYIGNYYQYSYVAGSSASSNSNLSTAANVDGNWKPLNSTDLKFSVYIAQFISDSYANTTVVDPVTGASKVNTVATSSYMLYKGDYEYIVYDFINSSNWNDLINGELIYQNNVVRPESITVISGNNIVTSQNVNFTTIFGNSNTNPKYMVIYSGTNKNIRKISSIQSNTKLTLEIPPTFSNASASFSKVVAGKVDIAARTSAFGKLENAIVLANSSANSTLRFTNNTIESVTINSGGSGYSNTNYIVIYNGGLSGGGVEANATANLSTNSTGGITSITLTDKGIGFYSAPSFTVLIANGSSASAGSGANLSFTIGSTLVTEMSNASLGNCHVINLPINSTVLGAVDVENPYGTSYYFKRHYLYYAKVDGISELKISAGGTGYSNSDTIAVSSGNGNGAYATIQTDSNGKIVATYLKNAGSGYTSAPTATITTSGGSGANVVPIIGVSRYDVNSGLNSSVINMFERAETTSANSALILSRSVEVLQDNNSITTVTGKTVNTNYSSVVEMVVSSNNVYVAADILSAEVDVFFEKYAINNDYTDENTGRGKAVSKQISFINSFANNYLAEDMLIYMDAYRPANTDIKVYAKILNNKDSEAFVDKDWTLLRIINNENAYSSPIDKTDLIEYTFGFYQYPNTSLTLSGTVTTSLSNSTVTGSNTNFSTDLSSGDLIRIYSPLFANSYMVTSVASVTNSTSIILDEFVANSDVVGSGFLVDKIGYPKQAFNNYLNNNIVRYYDSNNAIYDGYNTFAIKIVFLSDNNFIIPKVDNIKVVGVTA